MMEEIPDKNNHKISVDANYDKYAKRRKEKNGICPTCKRYNTWFLWCQSCDTKSLTQGWTSGNERLDELIKGNQLKAVAYNNSSYIQWISYDDLKDIEKIADGGFAAIYKATWKNGNKYVNHATEPIEISIVDRIVVLKKLIGSKDISDEFLNEFKNYVDFHAQFQILKIYGLTKDPISKEYIFVMKYITGGNLKDYLTKEFKNLKWKAKIDILIGIIGGLKTIHKKNIVHRDFHSGNILKENFDTYISDLGLSIPANKTSSDSIIGVIPYIAPEVLSSKPYTMKSDIYSFGVIMSLVSTGQQPFGNLPHKIELVMAICCGLRPAFSNNTPKFYIELASQCMNSDPNKRPTAQEIWEIIDSWRSSFIDNRSLKRDYKFSQEQINELTPFRKEFDKMDEILYKPATDLHPDAVYNSRIFNFPNLPQPVNSDKTTIFDHDTAMYEFTLPQDLESISN